MRGLPTSPPRKISLKTKPRSKNCGEECYHCLGSFVQWFSNAGSDIGFFVFHRNWIDVFRIGFFGVFNGLDHLGFRGTDLFGLGLFRCFDGAKMHCM